MRQNSEFISIPNKSGIYCIQNDLTGQKYIGSSVKIKKRITAHISLLRNRKHANIKLQRSFDKYGEKVFSFTVLELINEEFLIIREQYNVDAICPFFNIREIVQSSRGVKLSKETKSKMSIAKKGKPLNSRQKEVLSNNQKNRIGVPVKGKVKDSLKLGPLSMIGKKRSIDTIEKIRLSKLGKKFNKITRKYECK